MRDAWRAYLELATDLVGPPRRHLERAAGLVAQGGAVAGRARDVAGGLVAHAAATRLELARLLRFEAERLLSTVGLATAAEVSRLAERVVELERRVRERPSAPGGEETPGGRVHDVAAPPRSAAPGTGKAA